METLRDCSKKILDAVSLMLLHRNFRNMVAKWIPEVRHLRYIQFPWQIGKVKSSRMRPKTNKLINSEKLKIKGAEGLQAVSVVTWGCPV